MSGSSTVMAGLVPAIHVLFLLQEPEDVDVRDKRGHDDFGAQPLAANPESSDMHGACVWIPGPALTHRPGMTGKIRTSPAIMSLRANY